MMRLEELKKSDLDSMTEEQLTKLLCDQLIDLKNTIETPIRTSQGGSKQNNTRTVPIISSI